MKPNDTKPNWIGPLAGLAIPAAMGLLGFALFSSLAGIITGRDAGFHAYVFLLNADADSILGTLRGLFEGIQADYGPIHYLLCVPFWFAMGTVPTAFALPNLIILFCTLGLLAATLRRLDTPVGWTLVAGIALVGSNMGVGMYYSLNVDAIYTLAILAAFTAMIAPGPVSTSRWPTVFAAVLFCLLARLNTALYLLVPLAYQVALFFLERRRGESLGRVVASLVSRPIWLIALVAMMAMSLVYYGPKVEHFMPWNLVKGFNFHANPQAGVQFWSWANWTWFLRRVPQALPPALAIGLIPFAVYGWWKALVGRRVVTALFVAVPWLLYTLIVGTRKIEYIAPSLVLLLILGVVGIARVQNRVVKWGAVAFVLIVSTAQFFHSLGSPAPLSILAHHSLPNRVASRMLGWTCENLLHPDRVGVFDLSRRLAGEVVPPGQKGRMGILIQDENFGAISAWPLMENAPGRVDIRTFKDVAAMADVPLDLVLWVEFPWKKDLAAPEIPDRYRYIMTLELWQVDRIKVYLPKRPF